MRLAFSVTYISLRNSDRVDPTAGHKNEYDAKPTRRSLQQQADAHARCPARSAARPTAGPYARRGCGGVCAALLSATRVQLGNSRRATRLKRIALRHAYAHVGPVS